MEPTIQYSLSLLISIYVDIILKNTKKKNLKQYTSACSEVFDASIDPWEKHSQGHSLRQLYLPVHFTQAESTNEWHRTGSPREKGSHELGKHGSLCWVESLLCYFCCYYDILIFLFLDLYKLKTLPFTLWILALPRCPASWLLLIFVFSPLLWNSLIFTYQNTHNSCASLSVRKLHYIWLVRQRCFSLQEQPKLFFPKSVETNYPQQV